MPDATVAIRLTRDDPDYEVWAERLGKVGETVEVAPDLAQRLIAAGYAEPVVKAKGKK